MLATISVVLFVFCLLAAGYPVLAEGPPDQESGGVSSSSKIEFNISQLLLDSISESGSGGIKRESVTENAVTRDSGKRGKADASDASSGKATTGDELLSGITKDDFETSQTVGDLVRFDRWGNVEVYIHLASTDEESLQQVRDAVELVEIEGPEYGLFQAWVDPKNLKVVADLDAVKRITPPDYGHTERGTKVTEGDAVHRANLVRAFSGLTGEGVKVGVVSDGVDAWGDARASSDLPSKIEINPNQRGDGEEGTALLEIIHDIAPDAELAFSGYGTSLGMAQAILWLANDAFEGEGADVIVEDVAFLFEPYFEDGKIAQAAEDAVAGGTVYVSAAGNSAEEHYEGSFVDNGYGFHAFDGNRDISMRLRAGSDRPVVLQWNDRFGGSGNDYELFVCPAGLMPTYFNLFNDICYASTNTQNGDDDPLEVVMVYGEDEVDVFIKKYSGQARRLEMFFYGSVALEYGVPEGSIVQQTAAAGVLAVGAVDEADPGNDDIEPYSNHGPSRIYFPSVEIRAKPDVVASDGVSVTGSGGFPSHFFGTSAAAPHVAGIAALLVEAQRLVDPTMTRKQVADAVTQKIRDTAIDLGPVGHDNHTGHGRADALAGVEAMDQLSGTTFTVDSTGDGADSDSSDGVCDDGNGNCTLRAAIQETNRLSVSLIKFDIAGSGTHTIQPASALPTITRTVFIDGFTQPGAGSSNYRIELDGTNAGTDTNGLTISGAETWVRGLVINRSSGNGIELQARRGKQVIEQNRIGTNTFGRGDSGNGKAGVLVVGAGRVIVRDNLISGNDEHGIEISGFSEYGKIDGNIIGADASGASDLGNTGSGIHISAAEYVSISNNVIVGNDSHGVSMPSSDSSKNLVAENLIGVNENGSAIANSGSGVHIGGGSDDNQVERNTIAHNTGDGVTVVSRWSTGNTVRENSIHSNGGLGIDLNDDGVTANDAGTDPDSGPNDLQNFAVLTSAGLSSDAGSIGFNLYVEENHEYIVDFYASDSCDGSGNGEGKEWLGFAIVVPSTFGDRHFVAHTFRSTLHQYDPPSGTYITATVSQDGNTSEFSPCVQKVALPRLTLSETALEVEEDSTTSTTYTVRLSNQLSDDATLDLTVMGDEAVTVSPETLTFTMDNWSHIQTVTVTAVSDEDPQNEYTVVQHKLTIDSKQYVSEWLPAEVQDDDVPGVSLASGTMTGVGLGFSLNEGDTATYSVVLTEEPEDDVTVKVRIPVSGVLTGSPATLTFTRDNYDTAQTVILTALTDFDIEDEVVPVHHKVEVDGSDYTVAMVLVLIEDLTIPDLTFSKNSLRVAEGDTETYTVVLDSEPSQTVKIRPTSSDTESVTVAPPSLTFTGGDGGNWQTPQTVTVTAIADDDEFEDMATIRHLVTYFGITNQPSEVVEVTVSDSNRAPFFEEGLKTTRSIDENSGQGTAVGDPVTATDLNNDTLTYEIEDQEGGPYTADIRTGQIRVAAGAYLNFEDRITQEVKLTVEDEDGLSDTIHVSMEIADVDEAPVITGDASPTFAENANINNPITRYTATDPEGGSVTWSASELNSRGYFSLDPNGNTLDLKFAQQPDHEDKDEFRIIIIARDYSDPPNSGKLNVTVKVGDVNEPPKVTGDIAPSVDENNDTFSQIYAATDPEGSASTITWSLSGTDSGDFDIDRNKGILTFRNAPNFEIPADSNRNNEYLVTVRASDGQYTGTLDVAIDVDDVNEAPEFSSSSSGGISLSFPENRTSALYTYQATDPENGPVFWSLAGTDREDFDISDAGVLSFVNIPDFEFPADLDQDNEYLVTVEVRDGAFNYARLEVAVNVSNASGTEEPTITTTSKPDLTYQENGTSTVYTFRANDPQQGPITWSLAGADADDFTITESGALTFTNPPDFENPTDFNRDNVYEVEVIATDEQSLPDSFDVNITVTNHAESVEPTITTRRPPSTYRELGTNPVYTFRASDPQGRPITWSLEGDDRGDFTITSDSRGRGVLAFRTPPDFEIPNDADSNNVYKVTVVGTDEDDHQDKLALTITVTDVAEAPTISTRPSSGLTYHNLSYPEDRTSAVYTYRASDPQREPINWSVTGTDADDFAISATGALSFTIQPDYESPSDSDQDRVYEVTVVATDEQSLTDNLHVRITVTPVNEGPEVAGGGDSFAVQENRNWPGASFTASDPEGGSVTGWALGGRDGGDFTVSGTGVMTFRYSPDYERPADSDRDNLYEVEVRPYDGRYYGSHHVTVTVEDVSEITGPATLSPADNFEGVLATYSAGGRGDLTVEPAWRLTGTDSGDFSVDENGQLTFRSTPDHERPADSNRDNVYTFTVQASDDRYYSSFDVTVTVTDIDEPPTITTTSTSATALGQKENLTSRLYTYSATDPEGETITWSVGGTDGRFFAIDDQGQFSFKEENPPDFEIPGDSGGDNVYDVAIQVRDDGFNTRSLPVTVTVRDVNEGPEVTSGPSTFTIDENQDLPNAVYAGFDPEGGTVTRWNVGGRDGGDFTITQEGLLTFRNLPDYERPADSNRDNVYELQIRPYDGRYYGSFDVTVTINDVNEPPEIRSGSKTAFTQKENLTPRLYTYSATDPESSTVTWSVGGTDARFFTIDEGGQFSFRETSPPDFEQPGDSGGDNVYDVTVQARDDGFNTASLPVTVTVSNDPEGVEPTISTRRPPSTYRENGSSTVYTFRASEPQRGPISWSLEGTDGGDFAITKDSSGRGALTFSPSPDFENPSDSDRQNDYELTVVATDEDGHSDKLSFTITVTEVNEGPEISRVGSAPGSVPENYDPSSVLARYAATDPEDPSAQITRWSTSGRDGGDFIMNEQGELRFRHTPDYERPADSNRNNVYEVTVRASDGRVYGNFDETITVTPVNEPPTITTTGSSATALRQNENLTSRLYTYRATDPEGGSTIAWSVGGVDARFFAIDERGQFSFREENPPNYEIPDDSGGDNVYDVTIEVRDDGFNTRSLPVTVTVREVDEGPEVSGQSSFTINENRGLSNAAYTATDPEGLNVARWTVGGRDGGDFFITQGGTLFFRSPPDYERPADSNRDNVYEVTIQPSDGRNNGSYPVTVNVNDVNEPPAFKRGSRTSFTQPENRTSRLYTYSAADPEKGEITWLLGGTDGGRFTIDERGRFSFNETSPPDFDTPGDVGGNNLYNLTIQVRDPEFNTASLPVTVLVTEVNEGPVISRQGSAPGSVPENHPATQALATFSASDPERPSVKITRWSTSGRDGGGFVINALGELRFRNSPDYERPADSNRDNVYEVTIRASDGRKTGVLEEVQTVTVTDVNEPPTITTTSRTAFSQPENRTSTLYTFRAADPERGTVTWTPTGTDGSAFTMDERGALSFSSPPDFEDPTDTGRDNVYNVTVQARDGAFNIDSLDVVVTVTDHNEGEEPTITTRRPPAAYRENDARPVYTFRASDPQRGATIRWSLTGTDAGDFTITGDSSGRGVLAFARPPDFESPDDGDRDNAYQLAVVATDDDGNTDRVDFTIAVTDHSEGVEPTISTQRPPSTYRENDTRPVYTFRASDPQRGTAITWSVTGIDAGDFTITADSGGRGVLTFNTPPDFESPTDSDQNNEYQLAVVAADGDGNTDRVDFAVTVTDINEGPQISLEGTARTIVPENTAETQVLADYTARDPENPNAGIYRWSTAGRDGGDFVISDLGELRFRSSPDYERPADSNRDNVYEVIIRACDARTCGMLEETLEVTVTEVNESPTITTKSRTGFSLQENSTSIIYTYRATDQDKDDVITWSVEGADGEDFAIYNGILNFRLLPDLEIPVDADRDNVYEITVVAADRAGLRDTVNAVITITDQPEGPVIAGRNSYTVTENYDITQVLGSYTATDAKDGRAVFPQWSLSGRDGGDFVIDRYSAALAFRNTPDYDRPADSNRDNVYQVTVRGHDSRAYGNLDVTVTVTPINEGAPVVAGRAANTVRENATSAIYTYRATDPDRGDTIAWSTGGSDGHLFEMSDRGELSFREAPNFENPRDSGQDNVYDLDVIATDGEGLRGILEVSVTVTALNEGPVVSGTAAFTISENQDLPGAVYTARDPEATGGVTTTITWSVSGRDGGDFAIDRDTGVLTFRTPPDYERPADSNLDNVYEITIRAHDGRTYGNFDVEVTVEDVVEVTGPAVLSRSENFEGVLATYSAAGLGVLDVTPAWRITGADRGDLTISEQGEVTFRSIPDYERPADANRDNVYTFVVEVSDGSYYGVLEVAVTVTPVNEPPAITGRDSLSFRENTPVTTRLHAYRATDPEGDAFTWGLSGNDAGDFEISEQGVLTFASPPNFDSPAGSGADGNQYLVTVQARDDQGNTGELPVVVAVTDQNEGAVVTGQDTIAVQENRDPTLTLAAYSAADPEGQVITRWSLVGSDGGDFLISENGELTFRNTPDYDRPSDSNRDNEYRVTVRAYDGRTYGNLDVTVTVSNQNEHAPVIRSGSRTSFTYREEGTSALYTYSATDGDRDDAITWITAGTDGNLFEFNDGNGLVFREPPDYENPSDSGGNNEYELTVVATDSGRLTDSLDVTVTVTAVEEGPEITGPAAYTVTENQELAGATFTATDPEDPSAAVTGWSLAGSDAGDFTITGTGQNSSQLTFRDMPDYDRPADSNRDNEYLATIRAYNGSTYGSLDVTVTVTDVNEFSPVVTGRGALSFRENTTSALHTYRAADMDRGAEFVWSVRGTDGGDFSIGENGELSFSSNPNHEQPADSDFDNVYQITVAASDGTNEATLDVTVTVTEVNEGPEISGRDTLTVNENHEALLATYTGTDPEDTTAAITRWSVTGRDGGDFSINEQGELTFRTPPDHERPADSNQDNVYEVTVRASDGRVYGTYDVTVTVEPVDEAPEFQRGSKTSFSYRENGASVLYTYRATDPEGAGFTWSLGGDDAGDFEITGDGGILTFREPPDFDEPADDNGDNDYEVTVVATDQTGHGANLPVTVTVTDVNEAPDISATGTNTAITVQENHHQVLSTYSGTDPEDPDAGINRWSVTGRDGGDFAISEAGELTFRNPPDFERPADSNRDNTYEVTVRASDGRYYGTLNVTVTVEAVDEAPEFQRNTQDAFAYQENGASAIYTYRATDPEGSEVAWGLSGTDSSAFTMSETGVLSFNSPPDYEEPEDSDDDNVYFVTVEASDDQSNTARLEVMVTVTNLTDSRVSISGTAQAGRTLRADTSEVAEKEGTPKAAYSYQWLADDKDIEDATGSTYEVSDEDKGKTIKVKVTFTDDAGNEETLTSAATAAVAVAPATTPLTASHEDAPASHDGQDSFTFKLRFSEEVELSYLTLQDQAFTVTGGTVTRAQRLTQGSSIGWRVTATPGSDADVTLVLPATTDCAATGAVCTDGGKKLSAALSLTVPGPEPPQQNSEAAGAPTISGTVRVGEMLTADTSGIADEDGIDNASFSYQWLADDKDIAGATEATYTLGSAAQGKTIKVRVSFDDDAGNEETLTSAATAAVAARPNTPATGTPTISGTAQVGETLTAETSGIADEDGLDNVTFGYQWTRDDGSTDTDVAGATGSTYELGSDDLEKTIKVRVSFEDDAGHQESLTSQSVGPVDHQVNQQQANSPATGASTISGTAQVGETLTAATTGIADEDGLDNAVFSYQWLADDANIQDETASTYTLVTDDVGKAIRVRVSFTDDAGNEETLTSHAATAAVAPTTAQQHRPLDLPPSAVRPRWGRQLTADQRRASPTPTGWTNASFSYQWLADDAEHRRTRRQQPTPLADCRCRARPSRCG